MRNLITLMLLAFSQLFAYGQNENDSTSRVDSLPTVDSVTIATADSSPVKVRTYNLKPAVDIPLTAIGTGWSLYAFTEIYNKDKTPEEVILSLDKQDIPAFDRHGADVYHPEADEIGDLIFYSSMPLPLFLLFDKKVRRDGLKVALLYLESMSVTGLLYTSAVYFADRYRPYAYNDKAPMSERTRGGAKNSFFAGHVALVGTSTFFMAKILNDYHPDWKARWLPFTLAGAITATTGYLRYRGGQHFLSDILLGTAVGTLSGILVPHAHKNKNIADQRISFTASYMGDTPQFGIVYKFIK